MEEFIAALFVVAIAAGLFVWGHSCGTDDMELRAIKAGVGEYFIHTNHAKAFRWKTNP